MTELKRLSVREVPAFLRKYRFVGGHVRQVRVIQRGARNVAVEFRLSVCETIKELGSEPKLVRIAVRVGEVEEFRVQMRPGQPKAKIADARVSYLNGLFYVSFDSLGLDPGEVAQVFDFRVSEMFAAGRELSWRPIEPKPRPA